MVFVSHSHADRQLAKELGVLIEGAFSGMVSPFVSSDPGPTGGLAPGEEWFVQIADRLRAAEAVWVLATPTAVSRPWVYWEAGIGRALCPDGGVVVRVGLTAGEVPSPLNVFQSYDGLHDGDVGSLLGKVATKIGMSLRQILIDDCTYTWLESAKTHKPESKGGEDGPQILPERLDRLDAAIARVEALASAPQLTRAPRPRPRPQPLRSPMEDAYFSLEEFVSHAESLPEDWELDVRPLDIDRDVPVAVIRDGAIADIIYLSPHLLESLEDMSTSSARVATLLEDIRNSRDAGVPSEE